MVKLILETLTTPIGEMLIVADSEGYLRAADWSDHQERMARLLRLQYGDVVPQRGKVTATLRNGIQNYFHGDTRAIDELPTRTAGTAFQREVWAALRNIPSGTTVTYGTLAGRIGRPSAVRAVGLANGANPIGVVVPCHRVIGANGALTGYGGGVERKAWLLQHESKFTAS